MESIDENVDAAFKKLLKVYTFGYYLKSISLHLEYFYNTLDLSLKHLVENPFSRPESYCAFNYRIDAGPNEKRESQYPNLYD